MNTYWEQEERFYEVDNYLVQEEEQDMSYFNDNVLPLCGGMKVTIIWCMGVNSTSTKLIRPKIKLAYRPDDFKSACKVEEGCQERLPEVNRLQLDENKYKMLLSSCIDALWTYLE